MNPVETFGSRRSSNWNCVSHFEQMALNELILIGARVATFRSKLTRTVFEIGVKLMRGILLKRLLKVFSWCFNKNYTTKIGLYLSKYWIWIYKEVNSRTSKKIGVFIYMTENVPACLNKFLTFCFYCFT